MFRSTGKRVLGRLLNGSRLCYRLITELTPKERKIVARGTRKFVLIGGSAAAGYYFWKQHVDSLPRPVACSTATALEPTFLQGMGDKSLVKAQTPLLSSFASGLVAPLDLTKLYHLAPAPLTTASGKPVENSQLLAVFQAMGYAPLVRLGYEVLVDREMLDSMAAKIVEDSRQKVADFYWSLPVMLLRNPLAFNELRRKYVAATTTYDQVVRQQRTLRTDGERAFFLKIHELVQYKSFELLGAAAMTTGLKLGFERYLAAPSERLLMPYVHPPLRAVAWTLGPVVFVGSAGTRCTVPAEVVTGVARCISRGLPGAGIMFLGMLATYCKTERDVRAFFVSLERDYPEQCRLLIARASAPPAIQQK